MNEVSPMASQQLVRLLADRDRRLVVAALDIAGRRLKPSEIETISGLSLRRIVDAADRLNAGGLVELIDGEYVLDDSAFQRAARAEVAPRPPSAFADQPDEIARVLDIAFADGQLVHWPAKRSKRLVVLDYLCQQFEIGKRYKEAAVNDVLRSFNDDVATMRRYLVDEQYLDRSNGEYWRCGGSV